MSKILTLAVATVLFSLSVQHGVSADTWVEGYARKDGREVRGHWRSTPNGTDRDNWSTWPNVNPRTGKRGEKFPKPGFDKDRQDYFAWKEKRRVLKHFAHCPPSHRLAVVRL